MKHSTTLFVSMIVGLALPATAAWGGEDVAGAKAIPTNVGDAASNKKLSAARAKSVTAAIVASGIDAARLSAAGFGQEKPVADNRTEAGRAKNRRVELVKKS